MFIVSKPRPSASVIIQHNKAFNISIVKNHNGRTALERSVINYLERGVGGGGLNMYTFIRSFSKVYVNKLDHPAHTRG